MLIWLKACWRVRFPYSSLSTYWFNLSILGDWTNIFFIVSSIMNHLHVNPMSTFGLSFIFIQRFILNVFSSAGPSACEMADMSVKLLSDIILSIFLPLSLSRILLDFLYFLLHLEPICIFCWL